MCTNCSKQRFVLNLFSLFVLEFRIKIKMGDEVEQVGQKSMKTRYTDSQTNCTFYLLEGWVVADCGCYYAPPG